METISKDQKLPSAEMLYKRTALVHGCATVISWGKYCQPNDGKKDFSHNSNIFNRSHETFSLQITENKRI